MLHFLTLKDDVTNDAQNHFNLSSHSLSLFPSLLNEDQIQKVIFDDKYIKFMQQRQDPQSSYLENSKNNQSYGGGSRTSKKEKAFENV